jgi:hypothetical protein
VAVDEASSAQTPTTLTTASHQPPPHEASSVDTDADDSVTSAAAIDGSGFHELAARSWRRHRR